MKNKKENFMLVNLTINLFNGDKVTTFSEHEYDLSTYPSKSFNKDEVIKHFTKVVKQYEPEFKKDKFSYDLNKSKKIMELSYFTQDNKMEYNMNVSY